MKISIAEQITNARQAAGMTQEELASALHVTRSAVSSWERGRTEPDLDTLRQLAQTLKCSFSTEDANEGAEAAAEQAPAAQPAKAGRKTGLIIGIVALVAVLAVCAVLFVVPAIQRNAKLAKLPPAVKVAPEDLLLTPPEQLNAEWFQQGNVRAEGEPWLEITTRINCDTANFSEPYWEFGAAFQEATGLPFTLERIDYYIFWQEKAGSNGLMVDTGSSDELLVDDNRPDYWEFNCGLPVQDLIGAGYLAIGRDGANRPISFRAYIDFTKAPRE